jgi:hypothetical protein
MTTRTTTAIVTFKSSFTLPGWDESWPGGDYVVTTDEELLDTSFPAYRRVSTTIALRKGLVTRHINIDPIELASAIERDNQTAHCHQGDSLGVSYRRQG